MSISVISEKPTAVLLDLDNTLYEYAPAHEAALEAVRVKSQQLLGVGRAEFDVLFERAKADVKARLGSVASSHSRLLYFQRLIELIGLKTQPLLTLDLEQTYWRSFLAKAQLVEGVHEFLDELQLCGVPRALVTDLTAQIQFRKLIFFKLEESFDFIVTSEEAGVEKPDITPFRVAIEKLGLKDSARGLWVIGDSVERDLAPAKRDLGATTFLIRHAASIGTADNSVDAVIGDFREMTRLVKRLFAELAPKHRVVGGGSK
jgi:putative hydrolase of the HAD superfamily